MGLWTFGSSIYSINTTLDNTCIAYFQKEIYCFKSSIRYKSFRFSLGYLFALFNLYSNKKVTGQVLWKKNAANTSYITSHEHWKYGSGKYIKQKRPATSCFYITWSI